MPWFTAAALRDPNLAELSRRIPPPPDRVQERCRYMSLAERAELARGRLFAGDRRGQLHSGVSFSLTGDRLVTVFAPGENCLLFDFFSPNSVPYSSIEDLVRPDVLKLAAATGPPP